MAGGDLAAGLAFSLGGSGNRIWEPLIQSGSGYCVEMRVRFPDPGNLVLPPSELSGSIWTLSSGSVGISAWYEKSSVQSLTGTVYVTSSSGRVELASVPIFDDRFYNISLVSDPSKGGMTLRAMRHEQDELVYSTSSFLPSGQAPITVYNVNIGSSSIQQSRGEFWAQELRVWSNPLSDIELEAHSLHFESYGREQTERNRELKIHWRLADHCEADSSGSISVLDSISTLSHGTGYGFAPGAIPFKRFLMHYAYIPSIDYGWNQEKARIYEGSRINPRDAYHDEPLVSLEFNMYDALNEDISHLLSSYGELENVLGLPINKYREGYEGLQQMRETYFKRLQGPLNFRVFVDMLDFFDSSFSSVVERLLPARTSFKGDELIVESHMLERPKYQYQLRPVIEGRIEVSGSISIVDRGDDFD